MRSPAKPVLLALTALVTTGLVTLAACRPGEQQPVPEATPAAEEQAGAMSRPTAVPTTIFITPEPDADQALEDAIPLLPTRQARFEAALKADPPIVTLDETSLEPDQRLAQQLALRDSEFAGYAWSVPDHYPLRSEIITVEPVPEDDASASAAACPDGSCYRVVLYNYAENMTSIAMVDVDARSVIDVSYLLDTQPELNDELTELAWQIAFNTSEVLDELGLDPAALAGSAAPAEADSAGAHSTDAESDAVESSDKLDALDAALSEEGIERLLNASECEQSRHLCAAPTFVVDSRALWVIVDLTEARTIAMRWTDTSALDEPPPTEAMLLGEQMDLLFCREPTELSRDGWSMDYIMTRSDGLEILDVEFEGRPVLRSAKVVDWHVSYEREEAFGYSDAVGCPRFSSAAVVAMQAPQIEAFGSSAGGHASSGSARGGGFAIVQDFVHPLWPAACMYNYRQRYEFYDDGRFRIAVASNGGGCGNDGTYRPVLRIVPAGDDLTFAAWDGESWQTWEQEQWQLQTPDTPYTDQGYGFRITNADGDGYYIEPGRRQFEDGGRGDNAFVYVTLYRPEEGDDDMFTIGPCCNTNYKQGPEKFIEPEPDDVEGTSIVVWYVPQLKNDDTPGAEYCWARADVVDGMYVARSWPCYAGPLFVPADGAGGT